MHSIRLMILATCLAQLPALAQSSASGSKAAKGAKSAPAKTGGSSAQAEALPSSVAPSSTDASGNAVPASEIAGAKTEANVQSNAAGDSAVKMRGLEEKVNDLKEKIFRSKARLMLLRETVLAGAVGGAKATIVHKNEIGSSLVLESVQYALDGAPLFSKVDSGGDLADRETIEVFSGNVVPGNHNLTVRLVYRGTGYGVFSYMKGYKFNVRSSYAFTAEEGKDLTIRAVAYEKGGITTDVKDRPDVRFDVETQAVDLAADAQKAGGAAAGQAAPAPTAP